MPSFDIISEIDMVEVKNATDNANRDIETRFDFRGVDATFEFIKEKVKMSADAEMQLRQMADILRTALVKRGIDTSAMDTGATAFSGKRVSAEVEFKQGLDTPMAKKVVKAIKDAKLKVQASINGDKVRVVGKKRDDLQATMQLIRNAELGQPFQFDNQRD
jgi:uncharacterized protein YajQ (UPF0234 family)